MEWLEHFPSLKQIESDSWRTACRNARVIELPPEQSLFHAGDPCRQFLLVIEGSIRVQKLAENGREILLYRVEAGQSCILTTACLLGSSPYQAEAFTETAVTAVLIPALEFGQALDECKAVRQFVFEGYGQRLTELLMLIEAISFGRLDSRLAERLLQAEGRELKTTHQQLARELGTAREVVSRTLKDFEHKGWVRLGRGSIALLAPEQLRGLSQR